MIEQNIKILESISKQETNYLATILNSKNRTNLVRCLYLFYHLYSNQKYLKDGLIKIRAMQFWEEFTEYYGVSISSDMLKRCISYLALLGLIEKVRNNDFEHSGSREILKYRITNLSIKDNLIMVIRRSELAKAHRLSIGRLSYAKLKDLQITDYDAQGNKIDLIEVVYPLYHPSKRQQEIHQTHLRGFTSYINEQVDKRGYIHPDKAIEAYARQIENDKSITAHTRFLQSLWNSDRKTILNGLVYRCPDKAERKALNYHYDQSWIIFRKRKKRVKAVTDLKKVQDYAISIGLTEEVKQIYVSFFSSKPNKKIRSLFKEGYFLSISGRLFKLDGENVREIKPDRNTQGRYLYRQPFIKGDGKIYKLYIYKLIFIAFGKDEAVSRGAKRTLNYAKGNSLLYHERYFSLHVHHMNGQRDNNNPENLFLMTREEHQELHNREGKEKESDN